MRVWTDKIMKETSFGSEVSEFSEVKLQTRFGVRSRSEAGQVPVWTDDRVARQAVREPHQ